MIVDLGTRQRQEVDRVAVDLSGVVESIVAMPPMGSKFVVAYEMPFVAWERVKQVLVSEALTTRGKRRAGVQPMAALRTISRIAAVQNEMLGHPALRGLAMLGPQPGWFPTWLDPLGYRHLVPVKNGRFEVLGPVWVEHQGAKPITVWTVKGLHPAGHRLAIEATHLACAGGA